jgi:ketosteroid isomerase-like protein
MPARTPADCDIQVTAAVNAGDLETAVALYESGAAVVSPSGETVTGIPAIREVLSSFIAMKPTLTIEVPLVVESGDTAVLHSKWALKGTDGDGNAVDTEGNGVEVVRRQTDGTWKFIIDNPFGTDITGITATRETLF